ncbi:MAG: pseudouridine-5'-phosphate glycosidase [Clostridiales bacterium]|nr:pseudouridine-5'-phosphate glycosidase [Clostridiales bacterium]
MNNYLEISAEVRNALDEGRPVVALESTIISHGFNYPENIECARECERIIRENGAVPATIGIIPGKLKVGLSESEVEIFATKKPVEKCSRRDLAAILSRKEYGASTVAATMIIAHMAGIKVFATGGIGGVHRGANISFDISADLEELAATPVAVVCAGVKSILDIKLTREYLETGGVPVIGFKTREFPSFYTRKSGTIVDYTMDTPEEIAETLKIKDKLGLKGGVLIVNPIPEKDALDFDYMENAINEAMKEAERNGIYGKETTPFLLDRLSHITAGKSVAANKALVYNNAKVAAQIAVKMCIPTAL